MAPLRHRAPAGVLPVLLLSAALLSGCAAAEPIPTPPSTAPAPGTTSTGIPTAAPSVSPTLAPTPAPGTAPAGEVGPTFAHQPLWPFADGAQVRAWQDAHRTGGQQPWHLDAGATALSFARDHLGFTGIDRVTATAVAGDDAWVDVGFALPDGRTSTAATVHLARWGAGPDAPWEVAGTRDSTLALDTPAYGAAVRTPLAVGGTVTGVDESLRVSVLGADGPVGQSCCLPAGGEHTRWTTTVPITAAAHGTLTVVVSTGGHVTGVERFAVTGVTMP